MAEKYLVEGYEFNTIEEANEAKKEYDAVKHIAEKTKGCSPDAVYLIYRRITDNNLFKTSVGLDYLQNLEKFLRENGMLDRVESKDGNNKKTLVEEILEKKEEVVKPDPRLIIESVEAELKKTKEKLISSVILNILLIIGMAAMMYIASTSSNVNILNYETVLLNKYSTWAQDLEQKEAELKERERILEDKEQSMK